MTKVFVSYRRQDSAAVAGRLADRLRQERRIGRVFLDTDAIAGGEDFTQRIRSSLQESDLCLVVIGPGWLGGEGEAARIRQAEDYVRLEVRTALEMGERIIPVLVDGASMPSASDLPEDIAGLAGINAVSMRHESFSRDADHLIEAVLERRTGPGERYWANHPVQWAIARSAIGAVVAGGGLVVALALLNAATGWALSDLLGGNAGLAMLLPLLLVAIGAATPHLIRRR